MDLHDGLLDFSTTPSLMCPARFASNIGIVLLNKHLLGGYGFRFPIFLTFCHMLACFIFSQVSASFIQSLLR